MSGSVGPTRAKALDLPMNTVSRTAPKPPIDARVRTVVEVDDDGTALLVIDGVPVIACPTLEDVLAHTGLLAFEIVRCA